MDLNRLTQKSQEALHDAQTKALRFGHTEVDGEHLLLALLDQSEGLVGPLLARAGADPDRLREDVEAELGRRPRVSGPGAARSGVRHPAALPLDRERLPEANRLKDEYVSVEHLVIALLDEGSSSAAGRLQQHGLTRNGFVSVDRSQGTSAGHVGDAGGYVRGARKVRPGPGCRGRGRPAGTGDRPRLRDPSYHPNPVPQDQEQPGTDR